MAVAPRAGLFEAAGEGVGVGESVGWRGLGEAVRRVEEEPVAGEEGVGGTEAAAEGVKGGEGVAEGVSSGVEEGGPAVGVLESAGVRELKGELVPPREVLGEGVKSPLEGEADPDEERSEEGVELA